MFLETNLWGKIINTHVSILSSSLVHSYFRGPWFVLIQIYTPCECFVQGWNLSNLFLRRFFLHVNPNIFSRFLQISLKEDMPLFYILTNFDMCRVWLKSSVVLEKKLNKSKATDRDTDRRHTKFDQIRSAYALSIYKLNIFISFSVLVGIV